MTSSALGKWLLSICCVSLLSIAGRAADDYVALYEGKGFDGWTLKTRDKNEETARKVFAEAPGAVIHCYRDFPDGHQLNLGKNDTHAIMVTKRSYSRYSFKFEYKWGAKTLNNFGRWQYDAGCYYHMIDEKVWPASLEFQIRYNHLERRNHTGDLWDLGVSFTTTQKVSADDKTWLAPGEGGVETRSKQGEYRAAVLPPEKFHALDDGWNECEIIVMGDAYVIHKLNGVVVNVATRLTKGEGPISLQAETAEIFYRNIRIKEFAEAVPMEAFLR